MTVPLRAALYLRVSTAQQAEHDVSIPTRSARVRLTASHAAISWSKPLSSRAHRPPMTEGPSSSG